MRDFVVEWTYSIFISKVKTGTSINKYILILIKEKDFLFAPILETHIQLL